jgi:PKD repeat protein
VAVVQGTAPTASFTFSPTSPGQFEIVQFTAEASRVGVTGRTITKYEWKFGDGVNATGVTVSHSYNVLETFPVTLTVTDSAGIQGTTSQNVTVVSGVTADFTISPTNPTVGEAVIFNAEASKGSAGFAGRNPIVSYIWNFGVTTDIVTVGGPRTCTTFPSVKTYTINLTVVDSANRRGTIARTLTVAAGAGAGCP